MKQKGSGAILNVASTAGVSPRPRLNWYNCSKGWMITATKTMAVELGTCRCSRQRHQPGGGRNPAAQILHGRGYARKSGPSFSPPFHSGRFSTPEDMGNAACFLCSDEAAMITGVAMEVDGGRCI
jgi:3-oxoacyl-[acyl-carrier protein] reductase